MRIVVVEDDHFFSLKLESMLESLSDYEFVSRASSIEDARRDINKFNPDIVIADIRLQDKSTGIDLAKEFIDRSLSFIFVTAFSDEKVYNQSKRFVGSKFIVKPFDILTLKGLLDDISSSILKLSSALTVKDESLFIKKSNVYERVQLNELNYFYSEGNYITFFSDKNKYILKYSLSKLLEIPKFSQFVRVHRSYAIHRDKLESVNFSTKLLSVAGAELPFGRTYVKDVRDLMDIKLR